jgi:hypothetical protein
MNRNDPLCPDCQDEIYMVRHHSLFAPRDFDVSPYFEIVKPTLRQGFDFHGVQWSDLTNPAETNSAALTTGFDR